MRDAYRYKGESEPIDLVAGHIPGAINIPFSENLDENGNFLKPEVLKEKYLKSNDGIFNGDKHKKLISSLKNFQIKSMDFNINPLIFKGHFAILSLFEIIIRFPIY